MRVVAITGMGAVTSLGNDPAVVSDALNSGMSGVVPSTDERGLLPVDGLARAAVDVRPLLKRRKDRKLLPRAAELLLWAANTALGGERPAELGLFFGVGREPPDGGETEAALLACMNEGRFDIDLLAGPGRAAYPPLAPLRTLPNLVLAHVAIQLDARGPGGTRAGAEAAGLAAVVEGWRCVAEGRAECVLAGGADSYVDTGSARDQVRLGRAGPGRAPGEAGAVLRLEALQAAREVGRPVLAVVDAGGLRTGDGSSWRSPHEGALGSCGSAAAPLALVIAIQRGEAGVLEVGERSGAVSWLRWTAGCSW